MTDVRERVLAAYRAFNRGDLDGWLELMDPDVVLRSAGIFPGIDPLYRGHEELARFWHQIHEPWEEFVMEIDHMEELTEGFLVALRFRGRGLGSGVEVNMEFGHAIRVVNGLGTEIITRGTVEAAAEALRGG